MKTGKVQGKTAERHTSAEFVDFLEQVVSGCKPHQEIHIILDNLSAHKISQVEEFLQRNSNAKLHFTPTYSSWLNQVEIWFAAWNAKSLLEASSLPSRISHHALHSRLFAKTAHPFNWKYSDVRRRIFPC